jgi:hypothetical protein
VVEGWAESHLATHKARSYAPEVIADSSGEFYGNAVRFPTAEEAEAYVADLAMRWTLVTATRVVKSEDPPNYRWVNGTYERIDDV